MAHPLPTLYLVSDLHLPNGPFEWPQAALDADIVLVAGDLGTGDAFYFDLLKALDKPVVFVPGNHDFWTTDPDRTVAHILTDMRQAVAGSKAHVLYNEHCDIQGVRFIGSTLWASFGDWNAGLVEAARRTMRDYSYINATPRRTDSATDKTTGGFSPEIAYDWHLEARAYLAAALEASPLPTVVLTHMAPSYKSLEGAVRGEALNPANWASRGFERRDLTRVACYASNLEDLILRHRPLFWGHGHIHQRVDYPVGGTRVATNTRGYYQGPLTQSEADRFRLFGYSVTPAMTAESQARFEAYPFWGDGVGFDPNLVIQLADGLSPIFEAALPELLENLTELKTACDTLYPYLTHKDRVIRDSVKESFQRRSEEFDRATQAFLAPMVTAWASEHYHSHLADVRNQFDMLGFPDMQGARASFFSPFSTDKQIARWSLGHMKDILKALPLVCRAPARHREQVLKAIQRMRKAAATKGVRLTEKGPTAEPIWRELPPHGHGRIYLSGDEAAAESLGTELDRLVNPKIPRQFLFHFCSEAHASDWGDTL